MSLTNLNLSEVDTELFIGDTCVYLNKATALKLYDLLNSNNVFTIRKYTTEDPNWISQMVSYNMSPVPKEFIEEIDAARALGVTYREFMDGAKNESN